MLKILDQTMTTLKLQRLCACSIIYFCVVNTLVKNIALAVDDKSSEFKITSDKQLQDIFKMILSSKNSNRGGYLIQARTDPKRLIFISEKESNPTHLTNVTAKNIPHFSTGKTHNLLKDNPVNSLQDNIHQTAQLEKTVLHSEEQSPLFDNINVHLYLSDLSEHRINWKPRYNWIMRGYEGEGRLKRQSGSEVEKVNGQKTEASVEAMQAMKRVILIRCPFYACPRGHICDYYTRSCRPVLYPDFDY